MRHQQKMRDFANNLILLICVGSAAGVLFLIACPSLEAIGHKHVCHGFFLLLIVILIFARAGGGPKTRTKSKKNGPTS